MYNENEKRELFKSLYRTGVTNPTKLAMKLGVAKLIIEQWRDKEGLKPVRKVRTGYLNKLELFQKLYKTGSFTLAELCERVGVALGTIYNWQRKYFPDIPSSQRRYRDFVALYESKKFSLERITYFLRCRHESTIRYLAKYRDEKGLPPLRNQKRTSTQNADL